MKVVLRPGRVAAVAAVLAAATAGTAIAHPIATPPQRTDNAPKRSDQQRDRKPESVNLRFAAVAGKTSVRCGRLIEGLGTTGQSAQLMDLRFFVSDVKLHRTDGRAVSLKLDKDAAYRVTRGKQGVTLIDLENGTGACTEGTPGMNASVRGTVPAGDYRGVSWTVGVPFELNHTDAPAAPAPLNSAAMAWSWQVGRKFTKIEVTQPDGASPAWTAPAFYVHLGSGGCTGNPATGATVSCKAPNRSRVRLSRFDAKRQRIAVDLNAMLSGTDITANGAGAPGCMSQATDPECRGVFAAFGIDWKADGSGRGSSPAGRQTVFRALAR